MPKIAYFDCFSGISGDMIIGSLISSGLHLDNLRIELEKLKLKGFKIDAKRVIKNGISAIKFNVDGKEKVKHRHLSQINNIIERSRLDEDIKIQAKKILQRIAEAEAKVHNQPVEKVHFHEIGAIDTIVDVVCSLVGLKSLGVKKVYCSKLNVGSGFVKFSHGKFPVPAPATAEILKNIPIYATDSNTELATPTGAAIISTIAEKFCDLPLMEVDKIGYGAGTKEIDQPNVLRVFIGRLRVPFDSGQEAVCIIETNIDDMNPQLYDYVMGKLIQNGALDVYLTNILMKKNRPAVKLTVLSKPNEKEELVKIIFEETTSIGVRIRNEERKTLKREIKEVNTKYGKIRVKIARLDKKIVNKMPEYEDCKKIAKKKNISLIQIYNTIKDLKR
jgi:uncharacterized protein (TIGR00299 family) protein